jgi:hypothetical protein
MARTVAQLAQEQRVLAAALPLLERMAGLPEEALFR